MKIISRNEARQRGQRLYYSGTLCKHGHVCERRVSDSWCVTCHHNWHEAHPLYHKNYYGKHKDDPTFKQQNSQRMCLWAKNNPGRNAAKTRLYRTRKQEAQPLWADTNEMDNVYQRARELTEQTGVSYTVDHIVPLVHEDVCGLHVPANLRVITKSENSSKGNYFWPDMP